MGTFDFLNLDYITSDSKKPLFKTVERKHYVNRYPKLLCASSANAAGTGKQTSWVLDQNLPDFRRNAYRNAFLPWRRWPVDLEFQLGSSEVRQGVFV